MTISNSKGNHIVTPAANLRLQRTVVLVGLMGAGKTNIGKKTAQILSVPFFDSDQEVEIAAGMNVSDIFERHGEAAFRDAERKVINRLLEGPVSIIATGGGAYINKATRDVIADKAVCIWLRATLPVLYDRTSRSRRRPLLANGDAKAILAELIDKRHPVYAEADLIVDSDQGPAHATAATVLDTLIERGIVLDHGKRD